MLKKLILLALSRKKDNKTIQQKTKKTGKNDLKISFTTT